MTVYKGHEGEIKQIDSGAGSTTITAFVSSFSVDVEPNLDPVWEMGSRNAVKFKKGNEEITGSFDKMYSDTSFVSDAHDDSAITYRFEGKVKNPDLTLTLSEVTFTSWSWDLPEDDFVTESVDFQAQAMSTS